MFVDEIKSTTDGKREGWLCTCFWRGLTTQQLWWTSSTFNQQLSIRTNQVNSFSLFTQVNSFIGRLDHVAGNGSNRISLFQKLTCRRYLLINLMQRIYCTVKLPLPPVLLTSKLKTGKFSNTSFRSSVLAQTRFSVCEPGMNGYLTNSLKLWVGWVTSDWSLC